jgi:hypothetical protein
MSSEHLGHKGQLAKGMISGLKGLYGGRLQVLQTPLLHRTSLDLRS